MKINKAIQDEGYKTTDFQICSVLLYFSHRLSEIDKSNSSRCTFEIERKSNTEEVIEKFYDGRLLVEPKRFAAIQKDLKGRLFNQNAN
ncbi:MAG: DUF5659 domain-containing protein [Candidatus Moranbacteria bacterium]|nr:DUF5659 domain-containing protein [Candidatus Moranbacteria bacterium]